MLTLNSKTRKAEVSGSVYAKAVGSGKIKTKQTNKQKKHTRKPPFRNYGQFYTQYCRGNLALMLIIYKAFSPVGVMERLLFH